MKDTGQEDRNRTPTKKEQVLEVDCDRNPTEIYTAICKHDWDKVLAACLTHPEQGKTWVVKFTERGDGKEKKLAFRFLPLHAAVARGVPVQTAASLLMAFPEAVKIPDNRGMLPLHYACSNGASEECIAMLLMMYPKAASITEPQELTLPIHQLCQWGAISEEALRLLLLANPASIQAKDIHGKTPLYIINECREGDDVAVLIKMLKRCELAIDMSQQDQQNQKKDTTDRMAELERMLDAEKQRSAKLNAENEALQNEIEGYGKKEASLEKQVMELQVAMERLLSKKVAVDEKYSVVTDELSKLRAEMEKLAKDKKELEKLHKLSSATEKNLQSEMSNLEELLESFADRNTILKASVKSLTSDNTVQREKIEEMVTKMKMYEKIFEGWTVQMEQMKRAALQRELMFEDLLKKEKERNGAAIAEFEHFLKGFEQMTNAGETLDDDSKANNPVNVPDIFRLSSPPKKVSFGRILRSEGDQ